MIYIYLKKKFKQRVKSLLFSYNYTMDKKVNYYIYKDNRFMKSIYTQLFDELPDIGAIEYIGSKSVNNITSYRINGSKEKGENKNCENQEKIHKDLLDKNYIRSEMDFTENHGRNVIRIYANIDDVKDMVNNNLYNTVIEDIINHKCETFKEFIKLKGKMTLYDKYSNQDDIFIKVNENCIWLKKNLLDTDIVSLINILGEVNVIGYIVNFGNEKTPVIVKAIAVYV